MINRVSKHIVGVKSKRLITGVNLLALIEVNIESWNHATSPPSRLKMTAPELI